MGPGRSGRVTVTNSATKELFRGGLGWKADRMDPGGASSLWGNENKWPQQVFTKGDPVPWMRENFAASAPLGQLSAKNTAAWRACIRCPSWKTLNCPILSAHLHIQTGTRDSERMTPISRACGPH